MIMSLICVDRTSSFLRDLLYCVTFNTYLIWTASFMEFYAMICVALLIACLLDMILDSLWLTGDVRFEITAQVFHYFNYCNHSYFLLRKKKRYCLALVIETSRDCLVMSKNVGVIIISLSHGIMCQVCSFTYFLNNAQQLPWHVQYIEYLHKMCTAISLEYCMFTRLLFNFLWIVASTFFYFTTPNYILNMLLINRKACT